MKRTRGGRSHPPEPKVEKDRQLEIDAYLERKAEEQVKKEENECVEIAVKMKEKSTPKIRK